MRESIKFYSVKINIVSIISLFVYIFLIYINGFFYLYNLISYYIRYILFYTYNYFIADNYLICFKTNLLPFIRLR